MASHLYQLLNNIEDGRQKIIKQLKNKNQEVSSTDTFQTLASRIGALDVNNLNKNKEGWVRPTEWPDTTSFLLNAEEKENKKPEVIVLLNNSDDVTVLNAKQTSSTSTTPAFNADAYLMSDGTYYSSGKDVIRHTWDKSKDIDGKYRYILCYYFSSNPYTFILPTKCHIVEAVINAQFSSITNFPLAAGEKSIAFSGYEDLESIVILDTCKITTISYGGSNRLVSYLKDLKHIYLGPIKTINGRSGYEAFSYLPSLMHFEAPNLTSGNLFGYGSSYNNFHTIIAPKYNLVLSATNGSWTLNYIETASLKFSGYVPYTPYSEITLYGTSANPPINCLSVKYENINRRGSLDESFCFHAPLLTSLDISSVSLNFFSADESMYIGLNCPNLSSIKWPTYVYANIDIAHLKLDNASVENLINSLSDYGSTNTNNFIRLSEYNKAQLTEENIAIATSKGWKIK